ncbi:MAG: hypothetical protein PHY12_07995 [Eubacteriales bacterium]|nr:hypothetical protein [Eubacteriales bacterium]
MMKKFWAVLAALLVLTASFGAAAEATKLSESASAFDAQITFPEGAQVDAMTVDDTSLTSAAVEGKPLLTLTIAPSEEYDDLSMDALSGDELQQMFTALSGDLDAPVFTTGVAAGGYKYLYIDEKGEYDVGELVTLYDGYFLTLFFAYEDYRTLTDDDLAYALSVFDTLTLTSVK